MKQPELGRQISQIRAKQKITQNELAEKCNLNLRTIQRIESGEVTPRLYTLKIISDVLQFDFQPEVATSNKNVVHQVLETLSSRLRVPFVSLVIIGLNLIATMILIASPGLIDTLGLSSRSFRGLSLIYTFITYAMLHAGITHWFNVSIIILLSGAILEKEIGRISFVGLEVSAVLICPVYFMIVDYNNGTIIGAGFIAFSLIGASVATIRKKANAIDLIVNILIIILLLRALQTVFMIIDQTTIPKFISMIYGFMFVKIKMSRSSRMRNTHPIAGKDGFG